MSAQSRRSTPGFGRGRVAASSAGVGLGRDARRVIIKSRFVVLKRAGVRSAAAHLHYIERDGTTRDGMKGKAYGEDTDVADLQAFEERGRGDRHQFRFIVSVEDAAELEDLRGYTRSLMSRMAVDLEVRLDWVAVDHWDTDNPHTHIVLRGRTGEGKGADLVIAPDYMARGMRLRACELATQWLGPRTELEIRRSQAREVEQQRWTGLDRQLQRHAVSGEVDLTLLSAAARTATGALRRDLLRARLQGLEAMGLAERLEGHRWRLNPVMEQSLRTMGERGDILRTMHLAMKGQARELVLDPSKDVAIAGRIASRGMNGESHDRPYLVIDGVDGRAHFVRLAPGSQLAEFPIGGIVECRPQTLGRSLDREMLALAQDGMYTTERHRAQLLEAGSQDPQRVIDMHFRRLEALRRKSIVERVTDGIWAVPPDMLQRVRRLAEQEWPGPVVQLQSSLPLEQQIRAVGSTWLDRRLVAKEHFHPPAQGFGEQVRDAMSQRVDFLVGEGLAKRQGPHVVPARNLLGTLRDRELSQVGLRVQQETGKRWRPLEDGKGYKGVYTRSMQLVSGRFAMLDDGGGFSLVPWKPLIEPYLGRSIALELHGGVVTWNLGVQRGLSR